MSKQLRVRRLQKCLNNTHSAGIKEDGKFGLKTLGALESVFEIGKTQQLSLSSDSLEFDERTEKNLATLDPLALETMRKLVTIAKQVAKEEGVDAKVISGHRTWEEQDKLYAQGRTAPGSIVTRARGGYSNHNFGIAIDLGIFKGSSYLDRSDPSEAARIHALIADRIKSEELNTVWGGDWKKFKDTPHHEIKTGLTMSQKRTKYFNDDSVLV